MIALNFFKLLAIYSLIIDSSILPTADVKLRKASLLLSLSILEQGHHFCGFPIHFLELPELWKRFLSIIFFLPADFF